ncbi:hypothetical protein [Embleya sp. AB8]|uniref:hypothetical protein n=1 Tax=Embleya sp. AB8 TaxID=3156304 RepID=UPI003C749480
MLTVLANGDSRFSFWPRVREFAVPPSMIELATARRCVGDWAGACAAARVDVDFELRVVARNHGHDIAARIRDDLRHLAPDLLRWHMPRIAPDGLLRPGLTIALVRYDDALCLVARTPPAWADAGQRISLALWDDSRGEAGPRRRWYPRLRPHRRFRLDLHRHLWDVRRVGELSVRSGADHEPRPGEHLAVDRWAAEAGILLRAEGRSAGRVGVRLDGRHRLGLAVVADNDGPGPPTWRIAATSADRSIAGLPILPDAATWVLPDLELLRTGAIRADRLHPLVARELVPDHTPAGTYRADRPHLVDCRGARHRIGVVDGVLVPLDHDPVEIRREELLAELTGTPLPCLQAIDTAHRRPDWLTGVRERLDHGDTAGALAVVERLLGPDALLRDGPLRDELEAAARRRITYGLFRAGLVGTGPGSRPVPDLDRIRPNRRRPTPRDGRARPHHASYR